MLEPVLGVPPPACRGVNAAQGALHKFEPPELIAQLCAAMLQGQASSLRLESPCWRFHLVSGAQRHALLCCAPVLCCCAVLRLVLRP